VDEINELKRSGMSIQAISELTGYDRKTIRKYLLKPVVPAYRSRPVSVSKLEPFKPYLSERMQVGIWNAQVLLRELRERNYTGGYTILKDWLKPQRESTQVVAVRRFETPPGKQAQVDWGHIGSLAENGDERKLWCFTITLGYSRMMMAEAATDQKLGTLLRMHETAFRQWGAVPAEILYDRMKTIWTGTDQRGEIIWNAVFLDFARYWGFTPRLCRPYRAQTKGKIESGVKYVRRNFLCGLLGREPASLADFNAELRRWVAEVANQRVHGTTRAQVLIRFDEDQFAMQPVNGRPGYPYRDDELRRVARDAYVSWRGSRYSVPWEYAGKEVWVRECDRDIEVRHGAERIATHAPAARQHQVVTLGEHHEGIPLGNRTAGKTLVHIQQGAPVVERRPLAAYESLAMTTVERLRTTLSALSLTAIDARLETLLESAAKKEPAYGDFLLEVMSAEADARRQRYLKTRLQLAHLPYVKTFDQFDFAFQPSIDERQIRELRTLRFVQEASNVILLGPPGVGKTHLAVALAESSIQSGQAAYFMTAHDLVTDLGRAYREGRLDRRLHIYLAPKVLVIDEMGYLPLTSSVRRS
jgi:transposase/DNA replication protein DnaC